MQMALNQLITKLRPQLLPLTESAFNSDLIIPSSIGNFYGDIYEKQLELAMNSQMNKEDKDGVPAYFE